MTTQFKTLLQAFTLLALLLFYASEGMAATSGTPLVDIVPDPSNPTTISPNTTITVKYRITNKAFSYPVLLLTPVQFGGLLSVTESNTQTTCTISTVDDDSHISLAQDTSCTLAYDITANNTVTTNAYINFQICSTDGRFCSKTASTYSWHPSSVPDSGSLSVTPSTPQIVTVNDTSVTLSITAVGVPSTVTIAPPASWSNRGVDITNHCPIPPNELSANDTCTISITSSQPNLAGNLGITGSNGTTTLVPIAFRQNGGLVFSVTGTTPTGTAIVVSETDNSTGTTWENAPNACQAPFILPTICQLGVYDANAGGQNAGCGTTTQNVDTNLYQLGFLSDLNGQSGGYYWSSSPYTEPNVSWVQFFYRNGDDYTNSSQGPFQNSSLRSVRCIYSYPF